MSDLLLSLLIVLAALVAVALALRWAARGSLQEGRNPTLSVPAVFPGQVDMFPADRRDVGEEIGFRGRA